MPMTLGANPRFRSRVSIHAPAANTAAIVTLAAVTGQRHVISQIDYSYAVANPTAASLTVTNLVDQAGTTVTYTLTLPLVMAAEQLFFPEFLIGVEGAAVVVTLEAGGGTTVGKLNVIHAK